MTQTGKTVLGGIAVLLLVLLLVGLGSRSLKTNLESDSRATSTLENGVATTSQTQTPPRQDPLNPLKGITSEEGKKCVAAGGVWSEAYKECAAVDQKTCKSIGGTYNECASPCRNDPKAEFCIEMCVEICSLK